MINTGAFWGLGIGAVMGLTGAGGGILAIPALVLGMGLGMVEAKPVALIAVALGAAIGAAGGLWQGLVRYKAALMMVLWGAVASPVGQWMGQRLPASVLTGLFSTILIVVAVSTWRKTLPHAPPVALATSRPCQLHDASGKFVWTPRCLITMSGIGAVTGLMTGMLGVGGGFFIVPMLQRYTTLTLQGVVVTTLAVIALISGSTALHLVAQGGDVALHHAAFIAGTGAGMVISRLGAARLPQRWLQRGFAVLVLGAAALLLLNALAPGVLARA